MTLRTVRILLLYQPSIVMNFWNFLSQRTSEQEKDYVRQLFNIASADGRLDDVELEYIVSVGKKLDFSEEEVQQLREGQELDGGSPRARRDKDSRFFMLFSLINLILADGEIHPREMRVTENIIMKLGYDPDTVKVILNAICRNKLRGISPEATYEHLRRHLA